MRSRLAAAAARRPVWALCVFLQRPQDSGSQLVQARLLLTQTQLPPRWEQVLPREHEQQTTSLAFSEEVLRFWRLEDRLPGGRASGGEPPDSWVDCEPSISEIDGKVAR